MIKLQKVQEPSVLRKNSANWTKAILDKVACGEKPTAHEKRQYAHPDIKNALVNETNGKCAYCESKIRHVAHGDIEHIVPKSIVPNRWFEWGNLTLACEVCNLKKSNFLGDHDTFVDPYTVNPEDFFDFLGATIFPKPGNDAAAITEKLLELNRAELLERRAERLKGLMTLIDNIARVKDSTLKSILQSDFLEETQDSREFAGLAREIAKIAKNKFNISV